MNREDIVRMAREADIKFKTDVFRSDFCDGVYEDDLERFAELVRKDYSTTHANIWLDRIHKFMLEEREACAKVCEQYENDMGYGQPQKCADAIRARSNQ